MLCLHWNLKCCRPGGWLAWCRKKGFNSCHISVTWWRPVWECQSQWNPQDCDLQVSPPGLTATSAALELMDYFFIPNSRHESSCDPPYWCLLFLVTCIVDQTVGCGENPPRSGGWCRVTTTNKASPFWYESSTTEKSIFFWGAQPEKGEPRVLTYLG